MKEDLAACLEGFRGSGQLESSGEFTLSRDHAQKKLQQFALPEPRLYVLNMVAGAVVGKASFVEFKADADELWMSCDARLEDPSELESFESVALSNRAGSPLKEFAIGLGGLLPLQPARVTLEVRDPRGSGRLSWDGEKYRYQELPETVAEPGVKLYVRERLGLRSTRKLLAGVGGGMLPDSEADAVFRYCNRCPIRVVFNGQQANRPVVLGHASHLTFSPEPFPPGHLLAQLGSPRLCPKGMSGLLAIGGRLAPWVTLVYQGVNFRLPESAFGRRNLRGIVYSDRLRKDLSQVQLVQDEAFSELLVDIKAMATRL